MESNDRVFFVVIVGKSLFVFAGCIRWWDCMNGEGIELEIIVFHTVFGFTQENTVVSAWRSF